VASRLRPLRHQHVHPCLAGLYRLARRGALVHHHGAGIMRPRRCVHELLGAAAKEGEDRRALLQTGGERVLVAEMQHQVHAERAVSQRPNARDLGARLVGGPAEAAQNTQAARRRDCRDQFRVGIPARHARLRHRIAHPQRLARRRVQHHASFPLPYDLDYTTCRAGA